jgi:hypothetical protein
VFEIENRETRSHDRERHVSILLPPHSSILPCTSAMPTTSRAHKSSKSVSNDKKIEEVTNELANLKIRPRTTKLPPTDTQLSPAEKLRNAMVIVNDVSQVLGAAIKSGWKIGSETSADSEWSQTRIIKVMEPVIGALSMLRTIYKEQQNRGKIVDVERAALGVVSKLNGLRMVSAHPIN